MANETYKIDADRDAKWGFAIRALRAGDASTALALFRSLAREGEQAAFREIGNIYELGGKGVEQDYKQAMRWYQRSFAEANDVQGCLALARFYYLGLGTNIDYAKAFEYYSMLENDSHPIAMFQLGQMYYLGQGVEPDLDKAAYYYKQAADQGHLYALRFMGHVKQRQGHIFSGTWLRVKGMVRLLLAIIIARQKYGDFRKDPRLRTC